MARFLLILFGTACCTALAPTSSAEGQPLDPSVPQGYQAGLAPVQGYRPPPMGTGAPTAPQSPARPADWPGGQPAPPQRVASLPQTAPAAPNPNPVAALLAESHRYQSTDRVAQVGNEVILAGEILPEIHLQMASMMEQQLAQGSPPPDIETCDKFREMAMRQLMPQHIQTKMLYAAAKREFPAEQIKKIEESINTSFRKDRLPQMKKQQKVTSDAELEIKLHGYGTSIEAQRIVYIEHSLASGFLGQQVKQNPEITHEMMLAYYQSHTNDFEEIAQAEWEDIEAKFDRFASKPEAYQALASWGNEVIQGRPFAEVARIHSQGPTAELGGKHDWTSKGALVSVVINDALFSLPVGQMSQILEDQKSFHIVRVVQRKEARRTPFTEVQTEIKKRIKNERANDEMKDYVAKLRANTPVWTIFDNTPDPNRNR